MSIESRIANALAGKAFLYDSTHYSEAYWEEAIEYAQMDGDTSELEFMLRKDLDNIREGNDEDRRTRGQEADYRYELSREDAA